VNISSFLKNVGHTGIKKKEFYADNKTQKYTLETIKMEEMASNDDVELQHYMLILHFTNKYVLESVQYGHTSNIQFSLWKFAQSRARLVIF
jgi:hypothetical protein